MTPQYPDPDEPCMGTQKMANEEILKRISAIIVDHLGVDPAKVIPGARMTDDLGADSLDLIEIGMAIEDEFGIDILDEIPRTGDGYTVDRIVELVAGKVGA